MASQWTALIITAITDFIINAGTAVIASMMAVGQAPVMPNTAVVVVAVLGGLVSGARTIQQALKMTPESLRGLKG